MRYSEVEHVRNWAVQVRKGLGELTVLAALREGEAYGYQLMQRLNGIDGLRMTESTVYPLLARLTSDEFVKVRTAPSPTGPRRRYYQLTKLGRSRLKEMSGLWRNVAVAVDRLLNGEKQ